MAIRRWLTGCAAALILPLIALLPATAHAADIPTKSPAKAIDAAHDWNGLYIGAVVAHGRGHSKHCDPLTGCDAGAAEFDLSGWLGGATVGYNWQWNNVVLGAEADWSWGHVKGSMASNAVFDCGNNNGTCKTDINALGTIRGRVGFAFDRFLPYFTLGAAFSRVSASDGNGSTNFFIEDTKMNTKFVWGVGLEYAFAPRWSAKFEYIRIGSLSDFTYGRVTGVCACFMTDTHYDVIRGGINYHFSSR